MARTGPDGSADGGRRPGGPEAGGIGRRATRTRDDGIDLEGGVDG